MGQGNRARSAASADAGTDRAIPPACARHFRKFDLPRRRYSEAAVTLVTETTASEDTRLTFLCPQVLLLKWRRSSPLTAVPFAPGQMMTPDKNLVAESWRRQGSQKKSVSADAYARDSALRSCARKRENNATS